MAQTNLKSAMRVPSEADTSIWTTDDVLEKLVVVDLATGEARPIDVDELAPSPTRLHSESGVGVGQVSELRPVAKVTKRVGVVTPEWAPRLVELARSPWVLGVIAALALGEGLFILSKSLGSGSAQTGAAAPAVVTALPSPGTTPAPAAPADISIPPDPKPEPPRSVDVPAGVATAGILAVRSNPSGAKVWIDGRTRGQTPLTVGGIAPGVHAVVIEGPTGRVEQTVLVEAGARATLFASVTQSSGSISVNAPAELQVLEGGKLLGTSRAERIMLEVGQHTLDFVNEALGFQARQVVEVAPGKATHIAMQLPNGSLNINALPWAEVFIDGRRMGETPLGNLQVPAGPHEITFRHPELGEMKRIVDVTLRQPARVTVDLQRKDK